MNDWTDSCLEFLADKYEELAIKGESLEQLAPMVTDYARDLGLIDDDETISMDAVRWQIRKLRTQGTPGGRKILHYRDYTVGEDEDLLAKSKGGVKIEYTEDENGNPTLSAEGQTDEITTVEELLQHARDKGYPDDLERFHITRTKRRTWPTPMKLGNSEDGFYLKKVQNHYVAVDFGLKKPIEDLNEHWQNLLADIQAAAEEHIPAALPKAFEPDGPYMFKPAMVDVHVGNLSWGEEVGEDWDLKIAERVFKATLLDLVSKMQAYVENGEVGQILWQVGQDFLHADSKSALTSNNTQLALDDRFLKVYRLAWQLQVWAINILRQIAPVVVKTVPGNHDELQTFTIGEVLYATFQHCDDVEIDNGPRLRKYHRYGNTLIGMTHGKYEKKNEFHKIIMSEAREDFGKTKWVEFHTGHYHHRSSRRYVQDYNDDMGVLVRILPTITAIDYWHYKTAYIATVRAAEAYLYHEERGLETVFHSQREVNLSDDRSDLRLT